ncbi:MAG: hypothetical protein AB7K35_17620, partial [Pseudorhodoplanes sp.]
PVAADHHNPGFLRVGGINKQLIGHEIPIARACAARVTIWLLTNFGSHDADTRLRGVIFRSREICVAAIGVAS